MLLATLFQRQGWTSARNQEGTSRRDNIPLLRSKPPARFVPRLEALEDRALPSYLFQTIDDPAGVQGSQPNDINNAGEIAGLYFDASGVLHSYKKIGNQYTTIDPPNESTTNPFSIATGINAEGQIVGGYRGSDGVQHGYLLSNGQYTTFDDPLAVHGTRTFGINAEGQIVGIYRDANRLTHGFLLVGGHYTTLDDPNAGTATGQGTIPFQINASGQINGFYIDANNVHHGFLFSHGQFTTVDDPLGALGTEGSGINDYGQIVGGYFSADGQTHGYLQVGSRFTTVDDPAGVGFSYADGINDAGQIVGVYLDATGFQHGFLATPIQDSPASVSGAAAAIGRNSGSIEAGLLSIAGLANSALPQAATSLASSPSANAGGGFVARSASPSMALTMLAGATGGNPLKTGDAGRVVPGGGGSVWDLGSFPFDWALVLARDPAWASNGLNLA